MIAVICERVAKSVYLECVLLIEDVLLFDVVHERIGKVSKNEQ